MSVKGHGNEYPVKARIHAVGGLSAHADADDLMRWVGNFKSNPRIHVVHGESESEQAFRNRLESELHLQASVPGDVLEL